MWVERVIGHFGKSVYRRFIVSTAALSSTAFAFISAARAATSSLLDQDVGKVYPMYGVAISPVVKYGPPNPTAMPVTNAPAFTGFPSFSWNPQPIHFTAPTFGQWFPSFPKLMGIATSDLVATVALIAYISLLMVAVLGLMVRGGAWQLKNRPKN